MNNNPKKQMWQVELYSPERMVNSWHAETLPSLDDDGWLSFDGGSPGAPKRIWLRVGEHFTVVVREK